MNPIISNNSFFDGKPFEAFLIPIDQYRSKHPFKLKIEEKYTQSALVYQQIFKEEEIEKFASFTLIDRLTDEPVFYAKRIQQLITEYENPTKEFSDEEMEEILSYYWKYRTEPVEVSEEEFSLLDDSDFQKALPHLRSFQTMFEETGAEKELIESSKKKAKFFKNIIESRVNKDVFLKLLNHQNKKLQLIYKRLLLEGKPSNSPSSPEKESVAVKEIFHKLDTMRVWHETIHILQQKDVGLLSDGKENINDIKCIEKADPVFYGQIEKQLSVIKKFTQDKQFSEKSQACLNLVKSEVEIKAKSDLAKVLVHVKNELSLSNIFDKLCFEKLDKSETLPISSKDPEYLQRAKEALDSRRYIAYYVCDKYEEFMDDTFIKLIQSIACIPRDYWFDMDKIKLAINKSK